MRKKLLTELTIPNLGELYLEWGNFKSHTSSIGTRLVLVHEKLRDYKEAAANMVGFMFKVDCGERNF